MKTKKDYKKTQEIVREAIHRIDPYALLAGGSPDDEFDSEIISIVGQLQRCGSGKDIAHAIARVLTSSFGEKFEPSEFETEGEHIYAELQQSGLI
jgi:hypothetical protein